MLYLSISEIDSTEPLDLLGDDAASFFEVRPSFKVWSRFMERYSIFILVSLEECELARVLRVSEDIESIATLFKS